MVLHKWLGEILHVAGCLVKDSADLISKLKHRVFPRSCRFLKLDIKDFYMSGDHSKLIEAVLPLFVSKRKAGRTHVVVNPWQPVCVL